LILTAIIATWGVVDTAGLAAFAQKHVAQQFNSRAWFIMLVASLIVATVLWLALSRYRAMAMSASGAMTIGPSSRPSAG
jgi:glycine betaine transporter